MTLPMFPLGTVLVPGGLLPLHVFEPRYREMMARLDPAAPEFGVVLIERGSEVGGSELRSGLGTVARVANAEQLPDGRWVLLAIGVHRIRVTRWLEDDPYPRAEVERLAEGPWRDGDDAALGAAEREVRRALALAAELGEAAAPAHVTLDREPVTAAWQLAALAPLGPTDRQALLAVDDPGPRLELLARLAAESAEVLAFRLGGA